MNTKTNQNKVTKTREATIIPSTDIYEEENKIILKVDLPGVPQENLDIQIDKNILKVEGKITIKTPENWTLHTNEFPYEKYAQTFQLNEELDTEKIKATLKEGVLTLEIPKKEEKQPRKIEIKIQ